jgi:hypothetical protein
MARGLARALTGLALLCASFAWAGWIYLHTIGDPNRLERVATAVVGDPAARTEIAASFTGQLVDTLGIDGELRPVVESAVVGALSDPRVTDDVIAAIGASHANALGVDDDRPTTIDTAGFMVAVRDQLVQISPEAADRIPVDGVGELTLPRFQPPGVGTLRRLAEPAVNSLALVALGLLGLSLLLGERRSTLRRYGVWALCSGLGWLLVPIIVNAAARTWADGVDAIVAAALTESRSTVLPVAMAIAGSGVAALVVSLLPAPGSSTRSAAAAASAGPVGPVGRVPASGPVYQAGPVRRPDPVTVAQPTARVDTFVRSAPAAPPPPHAPASGADPAHTPVMVVPGHTVDPWAAYFGDTSTR